jgi:hypothetical protein
MLLGLVLVAGSAYVLIANPFGGEQAAVTPTAGGQSLLPFPEVERIEPQEAKKALDEGTAIFVDTRDADAFNEATILTAVNIPVNEVESRMGELDKDTWIITFCT